MTEKAKQLEKEYHREYMKKWRANNKDKIKQAQERYWEKKAKELNKSLEG